MNKRSKLKQIIQSDRVIKNINLNNGKEIQLVLIDTAGQEKFKDISFSQFKCNDCIVLGFDLTNKRTFESVKSSWIFEIKEYKCLKYLIGNKIDLFERIEVDKDEIIKFGYENGLRCFLTSCLTGEGVQNFLDYLVNELIKRRDNNIFF